MGLDIGGSKLMAASADSQRLRNLDVVYMPDVIVLGGGVAIGRGEQLFLDLQRIMKDMIKIIPQSEIRLSRLGHETALCGAVWIAIEGLG